MQVKQEIKQPFFYGYVIVFLVFLILGTTMLAVSTFGVFFKPIIEEFNWSRTIVSGPCL